VRLHIHVHEVGGLSPSDHAAILRGQLSLLRQRLEHGIPLTVDAVYGAERLARQVELEFAPGMCCVLESKVDRVAAGGNDGVGASDE
jgi:hypothetical protein